MKIHVSLERLYLFGYFILLILAGSILLVLPIAWRGPAPLNYIDTLFLATSAVCVTGLSTVDTSLFTRFGHIVLLFLIQFGGLGIVTFTTIFLALPRKKISLVSRSVVRDYYIDEIEHDPKNIMKHIVCITVSIESIGAILLYFPFYRHNPETALFDAVFHSVSAFCNAGFSTKFDSLEGYVADPLLNFTVMGLVIAGGIGFLVMQDFGRIVKRKKTTLSTYSRIVLLTTFFLILVGWISFFLLERNAAYRNLDTPTALIASLFQSVTPRTAGFDTIPQSGLNHVSILFVMMLMFVGGSSGSIAGGVKTSTLYIVLMSALKGVDEKNSFTTRNRSIPASTIIKANALIVKAVLIVVVGVAGVSLAEAGALATGTLTFSQVLFETVSAFGTVGLSLGITMQLTAGAKLVLVMVMFTGRVGIAALVWNLNRDRLERYAEFPATQVMIG